MSEAQPEARPTLVERVAQRLSLKRGGNRMPQIALLSFIAGFSGAMMPGPLLVAGIEQTAVQGLMAVVWLVTGHALLEAVLVLLLIAGLRSVIARPRVRAGIAIVGGAALLLMGGDMLWHASSVRLSLDGSAEAAWSIPMLILMGAVVSIANPYFTGWWATIGVGQLAQMTPKTKGEYGAFYLGHEAADYGWFLLIGLIIVTGRQWLTPDVYHGLILACGIALLGLGLWFLASSVGLMRQEAAAA